MSVFTSSEKWDYERRYFYSIVKAQILYFLSQPAQTWCIAAVRHERIPCYRSRCPFQKFTCWKSPDVCKLTGLQCLHGSCKSEVDRVLLYLPVWYIDIKIWKLTRIRLGQLFFADWSLLFRMVPSYPRLVDRHLMTLPASGGKTLCRKYCVIDVFVVLTFCAGICERTCL